MNIGNQGDADLVTNQLDGFDVFLLGHGHAHDLAANLFEPVNLGERLGDVEGVGGGHRLHRDGIVTSDNLPAEAHFAGLVAFDGRRVGH